MPSSLDIPAAIRVAVVDDDDDLRWIIAKMLDVDDRFEVVGQAATVEDAAAMVAESGPELVVTDLVVGHERLDVLGDFRAAASAPVVVVLSAHDRRTKESAAIAAGAHAYLEKAQVAELGDRLSEVCASVAAERGGR